MNTPVMDRLAALRPEPRWAQGEDTELLAGVLASEPNRRPPDARLTVVRPVRRRRLAIAAAVVAFGAAAAIAAPAMLPSDAPGGASPAAAAALHRLAGLAIHVPAADAPGPHQFRHMVKVERQVSAQGRTSQRIETWTAADGRVWQHAVRHVGAIRTEDTWVFPGGGDDFSYPSPAFLRSLPTEPGALRGYLRAHVRGSTSKDEAVFVAVGDMLRWGYAPPRLRAAAVEVLARSPHVSLGPTTRDPLGRAVQEFQFVDPDKRGDEVTSLLFDVHSVQIVGETTTASSLRFRSTVEKADVVDAVPRAILRTAVPEN